jgi:hypothetical protein
MWTRESRWGRTFSLLHSIRRVRVVGGGNAAAPTCSTKCFY